MPLRRSTRRNVTLLSGFAITLVALQFTVGIGAGLRTIANGAVSPFAATIRFVATPVGHFFSGSLNYSSLVQQNQQLRYELGQAQLRLNESRAFIQKLSHMSTELNVPFVGTLPTVSAEVSSFSPTSFAATIDISKGRDDGVLAGMPVVANGGLIGTVISTTLHGSTVRLITDQRSHFGSVFSNQGTSVIIAGRGLNNGLAAASVPISFNVRPGMMVFTDGLEGGLYPAGLPIARVSKVRLTPGAATYELNFRPTADLRHIYYVDVVLWEPST